MRKASWLIVWVMLPATAVLAFTSSQQSASVPTEAWIGVTVLGSLAVAFIAARRPRQRRHQH